MLHGSGLIATITLGLVAALGGGLLAVRLRLPPIVGYLLVGSGIGQRFQRRGVPFVVIEQSRRQVETLREHGIAALFGDAGSAALLARAHLAEARVLVIALPDPMTTRQIVEYARQQNPRLE